MATAIATAFVDFQANTTGIDRALRKTKKKVGGLGMAFGKLGKGLAIGAAIGGVLLLSKAVRGAFSAFGAEQQSIAKLNAILKSTGGAAGFTSKELVDMAQELQNVTTISNDVVINTQAMLATFKHIKGDQFKRATVSVLDMSEAMKNAGKSEADVKAAAIQLGKALNDPITQVSALARVGIMFSASEKEMIKTMAKAGDMVGAQGIILNELEEEFGGVAAAMKNTLPGAMKGLSNDFGDLGKAILGAFGAQDIQGVINSFALKIRKITETIKIMTERGVFTIWLSNIKATMGKAWIALKAPFQMMGALIGASIAKWVESFKWLGQSWAKIIQGKFDEIKPPPEHFLIAGIKAVADVAIKNGILIDKLENERVAKNKAAGKKKVEEEKVVAKKIEDIAKEVAKVVDKEEVKKQKAKKKTLGIGISSGFESISSLAQQAFFQGTEGAGVAGVAGGNVVGGGAGGAGGADTTFNSILTVLKNIDKNINNIANDPTRGTVFA